jgi:hypothetical protein
MNFLFNISLSYIYLKINYYINKENIFINLIMKLKLIAFLISLALILSRSLFKSGKKARHGPACLYTKSYVEIEIRYSEEKHLLDKSRNEVFNHLI